MRTKSLRARSFRARSFRARLSGVGIAGAVTALVVAVAPAMAASAHGADRPAADRIHKPAATRHLHAKRLCTTVKKAMTATCYAELLVNDSNDLAPASATPPASALTPAQAQDAYQVTGATSGGRTVAIVDAYGYPNLERDLGVFRSQFGLPACTRANGCLKIVDQNGGSALPASDLGWDGEQALDVDAVSSICPDCKIVVLQANSPTFANLGTAVQTAAGLPGVVAISNSYGGGDYSDTDLGSYYNHPGIAVTASTGDNGYQGASYPASSSYVTAVGGTSLHAASNTRGWTETVWNGAGSGCSTSNPALPAAKSAKTGCQTRAMADVSAVADPNNGGLAVYYPTSNTSSTWGQFGGTSEAAPIIAAVYALSGNTAGYANAIPYGHRSSLFDVTSGNNGSCRPKQVCKARKGWDGPTGLGTPNGTGAF